MLDHLYREEKYGKGKWEEEKGILKLETSKERKEKEGKVKREKGREKWEN